MTERRGIPKPGPHPDAGKGLYNNSGVKKANRTRELVNQLNTGNREKIAAAQKELTEIHGSADKAIKAADILTGGSGRIKKFFGR